MPFIDRMKKAFNNTKAEVQKAYSSIVDNTRDTGISIYNGAKNNLNTIIDGASDMGISIYNGAKENINTIVDGVSDTGNSIFSGAKETFNTAVNGARQLSDAESLGDAIDIVGNTGKGIVKTQRQTANNISQTVRNSRDQIIETSIGTYQKVSQTASNSHNQIVDNTNNVISDIVENDNEVRNQLKSSRDNISTTVTNAAEDVQETVSTKINETVNQVKELKEEYADPYIELTKETMVGGTDGFWDSMKKQNYLAGQIISEIYSGNASYDSVMQKIEDVNESYEIIRENKENGYQNITSELPESDQKEAREYALGLIKDRLQENKDSMPEYGDVSRYYNEGSVVDWLISHPASFALDAACGEGFYKDNVHDSKLLGEDGIFTPLNYLYYFQHSDDEEKGVRQDYATDMFGDFKSTVNINKNIENKEQLIAEMEANIDNPERFAELYYQATDGMNFSADRVHEYKQQSENGEKTKPVETIIGRDYITEDIAKNELGTQILKSVNKGVGTGLLKGYLGPTGVLIAAAGNSAVELLDAGTDGEALTEDEAVDIITQEVTGTLTSYISSAYADQACSQLSKGTARIVRPLVKLFVKKTING